MGDHNAANQEENPGMVAGWRKLHEGYPWFEGEGRFPVPAYSEFMPAPRVGIMPSGEIDPAIFSSTDPYGWQVTESEEQYQLQPGIEHIARQVMEHLIRLGEGLPENHIPGHKGANLQNNPFWPAELAAQAGRLTHEHYVAFLPLALSKTQDDKGRVLWTLFGGSEQGPETVFWKSFYTAPGVEVPEKDSLAFMFQLFSSVYGIQIDSPRMLLEAGFRIRSSSQDLPAWTRPYLIQDQASFEGVQFLLTFSPFSSLPVIVKERYLAGQLSLLPFPGSLVFWGMPTYIRLQKTLPLALQIPLLHTVARRGGSEGVRVPQSGWLFQPHPGIKPADYSPDLLRHRYVRTHRWDRIRRYEDELTRNPRTEHITKVVFSTDLETLGLYDKPMARNTQVWTNEFEMLLDGPVATRAEIHKAEAAVAAGGLFGYRFQFPAMQAGVHEVYWQRLAVAYRSPQNGEVAILPGSPLGYLTAYPLRSNDRLHPVELWPRLLRREQYLSALQRFSSPHDHYAHQTSLNLLALLDAQSQIGAERLPRSFARWLVRIPKQLTLEQWLDSLPERADEVAIGKQMQASLESILEPPEEAPPLPEAITYPETATRTFELAYWNDILTLAHGDYRYKDNADPVSQEQAQVRHHRDLELLGDYLLRRYQETINLVDMEGKALCGELPFQWQTDFDFPLFGGWKSNQEKHAHERDLLVVIPGKDRRQAVVLADHYDTAYMEDVYDVTRGGSGARLAAAGADDNHSATAVLLQAAPIFLRLARQGRLERDVWLLHLTGEEFPADCLGARHFSEMLVEKTLKLRTVDGADVDLSATELIGIFVMDMIAHNRDDDQDIFQISPGKSAQSLHCALQAHIANMVWNQGTAGWNMRPERRERGRGRRIAPGMYIPEIASHLKVYGEVRTKDNPMSSLYNTDGQIFSDIGAPVVLFMENYDINRSGYHDTKDTLDNIDLDYGAALAAIAIETAARMVT